jgi:[NiFe] hydrogenase diaphorase moiety large subunit
VDAIVEANLRKTGPVFFKDGIDYRAVLQSCLNRTPDEVIMSVIESSIRGRGGAGFPAGLKWRFARDAAGTEKYIICNADEGEPGTFKDRVLLTRSAMDVLLGMVICGYAVGSRHGILYLRAEYRYLQDFLEAELAAMRRAGLLGAGILGTAFDFDIRIQMGAGAYVCGDETALIESCEGKRGTPRVKPPFPIQQGYLGQPTVVNNVETLASITRILEMGAGWYAAMGTDESTGSRLLSVSGDVAQPGIYEVEWGITLKEVLEMVGARAAKAVQISGPSGECVSVAKGGNRRLCYGDLSCNGSLMVFDESRDLLDIARQFMHFFVEESCGICTPCRAGGVAMLDKIDRIIAGRGCQEDLEDCQSWGRLMRATSRCGLGTTAAKPILTTLRQFPELYHERLDAAEHVLLASFDRDDAVSHYDDIVRAIRAEADL